MDIVRKKVTEDLIEVGLKCPECDNGFLMHFGTPLKTNPKQWRHKCNKCGHIDEHITKPFSYLEYKGQEFGPMEAIRYEIEERNITHGNG